MIIPEKADSLLKVYIHNNTGNIILMEPLYFSYYKDREVISYEDAEVTGKVELRIGLSFDQYVKKEYTYLGRL